MMVPGPVLVMMMSSSGLHGGVIEVSRFVVLLVILPKP